MRGRHLAAVVAVLLAPALAWAQAEAEPPTWIATKDGLPFRVRFDPDHRLFVGVFADLRSRDGGGTPTPGVEMGLLLRSPTPDADWEVFWKRQHEIAHLAFRPAGAGAPGIAVEGRLYRGTFIRQSRNGSLTIPTAPPIRFPVPFDIGVLIELGRLDGVAWPQPGGPRVGRGCGSRRCPGRLLAFAPARTLAGGGRRRALRPRPRSRCDRRASTGPPGRPDDGADRHGAHQEHRRSSRGVYRRRRRVPLVQRARLGARLARRGRGGNHPARDQRSAAVAVRPRQRRGGRRHRTTRPARTGRNSIRRAAAVTRCQTVVSPRRPISAPRLPQAWRDRGRTFREGDVRPCERSPGRGNPRNSVFLPLPPPPPAPARGSRGPGLVFFVEEMFPWGGSSPPPGL